MPNEVTIITPDDERVKRGLATIAGYGGAAATGVAFAISQTEAWNIPVPVQIALLIASALLGAITGKGRQDQAIANRQATATVQAAILAPAPPPQVVNAGLVSGEVLEAPDGPDPLAS